MVRIGQQFAAKQLDKSIKQLDNLVAETAKKPEGPDANKQSGFAKFYEAMQKAQEIIIRNTFLASLMNKASKAEDDINRKANA